MVVKTTHLWHTRKAIIPSHTISERSTTLLGTFALFNPFILWTRAAVICLQQILDLS